MQWPSIFTVVHVFEEFMSTKGFQILIARLKYINQNGQF